MSFPGTGKIWMNGSLVDWKDANIHIASHVIHYGSGVFEGARCYETRTGPACFRLDAHLRRLIESAKIYRMESPYDQAIISAAVLETIRANGFKSCYLRPLVFRGAGLDCGKELLVLNVGGVLAVCHHVQRLGLVRQGVPDIRHNSGKHLVAAEVEKLMDATKGSRHASPRTGGERSPASRSNKAST